VPRGGAAPSPVDQGARECKRGAQSPWNLPAVATPLSAAPRLPSKANSAFVDKRQERLSLPVTPQKNTEISPLFKCDSTTRAFYGLRGPPAQTSWSLRGPKTRRNARGPHAGFPGASRPRASGVLRGQITTRRLAGRTTRRDGSLRIGRRHPVGPDLRFPDALEMPQSKSMR
jgi:hypothetical protein